MHTKLPRKVGDRVGSPPLKNPCRKCLDCREGRVKFCEVAEHSGVFADGAAAEYMVADSNWSVLIPKAVSFEAAAPLMCAGMPIRLLFEWYNVTI